MNFIVTSFTIWSKKVKKKILAKGLICIGGFVTIINVKLIIEIAKYAMHDGERTKQVY